MNIYAGKAKRLGCFEKMAKSERGFGVDSEGYHFGDAASYESHLDQIIKNLP